MSFSQLHAKNINLMQHLGYIDSLHDISVVGQNGAEDNKMEM
jgi:hypothetical protein